MTKQIEDKNLGYPGTPLQRPGSAFGPYPTSVWNTSMAGSEIAHRCARPSNRWGTGRLGTLQNAPTNPTLECKDDRFSRFSFSASHDHFGMTVWAPRQSATKRGDELIFGDCGVRFIHGAIVVSSYFGMFKERTLPTHFGYGNDRLGKTKRCTR